MHVRKQVRHSNFLLTFQWGFCCRISRIVPRRDQLFKKKVAVLEVEMTSNQDRLYDVMFLQACFYLRSQESNKRVKHCVSECENSGKIFYVPVFKLFMV